MTKDEDSKPAISARGADDDGSTEAQDPSAFPLDEPRRLGPEADVEHGAETAPVAEEAEPETSEEADAAEEEAEAESEGRLPSWARSLLEWVAVIGGALVVALVVKTFFVQAFWIPSPSMEPTLTKGDRVLVNKLADGIDDLNRGDVIVFRRPENGNGTHVESDINDLIKRVIGLPGDRIETRNDLIYVNGERLDEPYLAEGTTTEPMDPVTVPEGHVFVMGDNRGNSHDSRIFGPVPSENIIGRAFALVWPLNRIGGL